MRRLPTNAISRADTPCALISIGTNSTRLLLVERDGTPLARSVGTRLGRGLDANGKLDAAASALTLATIRDYLAVVRQHAAALDVIATSALRRAADAADFVSTVETLSGVSLRILSGDEEARYSFLGATYGGAERGRVGVLDVGGGSVELAVGTPAAIERTISLEIGAVRLAEQFPQLLGERALSPRARSDVIRQARSAVAAVLAPLAEFAPVAELIAVGGTVFTAAGMVCGDPAQDGVRLKRAHRLELIDELLARDINARRLLANIRPQRADILAAGLIVVDVACERLRVDELRVSHSDLLAGYLRSPHYRAVKEDRAGRKSNT